MQFSAYFVLSLMFHDFVLSEFRSTKKLKLKKMPYKISTDRDLALSGFLLVPILIASPVLRHKQNVNNDTKLKENHKNNCVVDVTDSLMQSKIQEDNNTEESFIQALDRGNDKRTDFSQLKANSTLDNLENFTTDRNTEDSVVNTLEVATSEPFVTEKITTAFYTTSGFQGIYPDAYYNNKEINSLALTIESPSLTLSPPSEKQWILFNLNANLSIFKENTTEPAVSDSLNNTRNSSVNETVSPIKGVYPAALYNNVEIDQLSITTNSYTNELPLPPSQDDRWNNFSSLTKRLQTSNEFRPLAGLYYDGFLQRPIIKSSGFMPYNR